MRILNVHNSCKPKLCAGGKLQRVHLSHRSPAWHTWHWRPPCALQSRASDRRHQDAPSRRGLLRDSEPSCGPSFPGLVTVSWPWGTSWDTWWRAASSLSWPHSASSATSPPSVCSEITGSRWRLHSGTIQTWLYLYWYYIGVFWITTISYKL